MLTLNRRSAQRLGGILSRAAKARTDECQKCGGWHVKEWRGRMKSAEYVSKACTCSCCRFSFAVSESFGFPIL